MIQFPDNCGELSPQFVASLPRRGAKLAKLDTGECDTCLQAFHYALIHNGFNDSAFAYCDQCGMTVLVSAWDRDTPAAAKLKVHGPVNPEAEAMLAPCPCGGAFRANALPRCPHCSVELSADVAANYIEANAPGTAKGWRWQRSWQGLYAVIVEGRSTKGRWR